MTNHEPRSVTSLPGPLAWRTSSYSGNTGGQCVEVAITTAGSGPTCLVRDSTDRTGPHLAVAPATWHAFITAIKTGTAEPADFSR